jgi:hypothetical protein
MARGRKTGGRQKGTRNRATAEARAAAAATGILPLAYMLSVMRDPDADQKRRDAMAMAAAPYLHPKLSAIESKLTPAASEAPAETNNLGRIRCAQRGSQPRSGVAAPPAEGAKDRLGPLCPVRRPLARFVVDAIVVRPAGKAGNAKTDQTTAPDRPGRPPCGRDRATHRHRLLCKSLQLTSGETFPIDATLDR